MALEVFWPTDIKNAILAIEEASRAALEAGNLDDQFTRGFQEGHASALIAVALAFGLIQPNEARPGERLAGLLTTQRWYRR